MGRASFQRILAVLAIPAALLLLQDRSGMAKETEGDLKEAETQEGETVAKVDIKDLPYPGVDPEKGGVAPLLEKARKSKINVVTWPGFQMLSGGGGSRVFVQILKGSAIHAVEQPVRVDKPPFKVAPNTLVYKFSESIVLLKNNYNPLVSKYFNSPVMKAKMKKHKKRVYLLIELKVPAAPVSEKFFAYQDDLYFFFVEFEPGSYLPKPAEE